MSSNEPFSGYRPPEDGPGQGQTPQEEISDTMVSGRAVSAEHTMPPSRMSGAGGVHNPQVLPTYTNPGAPTQDPRLMAGPPQAMPPSPPSDGQYAGQQHQEQYYPGASMPAAGAPPFPTRSQFAQAVGNEQMPGPVQAPYMPQGGGTAPMNPAGSTMPGAMPPYDAQESKGPGWGSLVAGMVLAAAIAVGSTVAITAGLGGFGESSGTVAAQSSGHAPVVTGDLPDWEAVAAAVRPATVTISAVSKESAGTGSGVIIDPKGVVVTNHHVVSGVIKGGELTVTLSDGRVFEGELVGTDSTTDLAVLEITGDPQDLTAANLASSSDLVVGQPVMAIGSPLGLSDTVTTGVISALDRPVTVTGEGAGDDPVVTNAIQVDAAINQGNSGGPLFDQTGAVIGINSSIASLGESAATAGSIGLGFAIPVDLVKSVTDQILTNGTVKHALLGVQVTTDVAEVDGANQVGALIDQVTPGGAAAEAGLAPGDVIIAAGGRPVVSGPSLTGYIRRYGAGDVVTLEVVRSGEKQEIDVTLQER